MITSPTKKYRLNGLFGGQECVSNLKKMILANLNIS